jgi:hypothetical protein
MRRPPLTREALGRSPLVEAGWADAARVERIPLISAGTRPAVVFAGRPAAERAADARQNRSSLAWLRELFCLLKTGRYEAPKV